MTTDTAVTGAAPGRTRLTSRPTRPRWALLVAAALLGIVLPFAVVSSIQAAQVAWIGVDLEIMRELGRRWLDTGTMYLPYQLAGTYSIDVQFPLTHTPALYPPPAGPLFAAVWLLPWPVAVAFWWGVSLAIMAYAFGRWRPSMLAWALIAAMFVHPMSALQLLSGGTAMWAMALVAAGLLWHWPAALILLKPTLLPFALIGARHRSWWIAAAIVGVLAMLGPWRDYIPVTLNGSASAGAWSSTGAIGYSLSSVPLLLVPVIAWLASTRFRAFSLTRAFRQRPSDRDHVQERLLGGYQLGARLLRRGYGLLPRRLQLDRTLPS